tara:strand:- start:271 stop:591 length:321 start_codon:yes stop_codon:yes gene_type:complete
MEIAKKALEIIKEQNTTTEENRCMQHYCDALTEIEAMKKELSEFKGKKTKSYKLKEKRTQILHNAIHSFYDSYFNMAKYKQMWSQEKQKNIEKEIEFISAIAKASR